MRNNEDVRTEMRRRGLMGYELSAELGWDESKLSKILRRDLDESTREKIFTAIDTAVGKRERGEGFVRRGPGFSAPYMAGITETAKLFGLAPYRVRRLCKEGKIVYIKCGSKYLVNCNRLSDYLNTGDGIG